MGRTELIKKEQKKKRQLLIIYVAISVITVLGTVIPFALPNGDTITGNGTIKFVNIEGGFYGIAAENGINYDPTNLNTSLQQDGLKITFQGKIRTDVANTRQWGTILDLTSQQKVP